MPDKHERITTVCATLARFHIDSSAYSYNVWEKWQYSPLVRRIVIQISGLFTNISNGIKAVTVLLTLSLAIFPISSSIYNSTIVGLEMFEYRYPIVISLLAIAFSDRIIKILLYTLRSMNFSSNQILKGRYLTSAILVINVVILSLSVGFCASSLSKFGYVYYKQFKYYGSDIIRQKLISSANNYVSRGDLSRANDVLEIILTAFPSDYRNKFVVLAKTGNTQKMDLSSSFIKKGQDLIDDGQKKIGFEFVSASLFFWPKNVDSIHYVQANRASVKEVYSSDLSQIAESCREGASFNIPKILQIAVSYNEDDTDANEDSGNAICHNLSQK